MRRLTIFAVRGMAVLLGLTATMAIPLTSAMAATLEVFHADSLSGPMRELKRAFEAQHPAVTINLTSGVSRELAGRILKGETCDVFAPSSPAVIDQDLMNKKVASTDRDAAAWYVVFSANEMVVITARGNPLGIRKIGDLARPDVKFARITGEKDLATNRTIEFVKRAAVLEGTPDLAQTIIDRAMVDPAKPMGVPDVVNAVRDGRASAGIVYYSAAVAARNDVDVVRFPNSVNLSEAIRNAATVPGTARNSKEALEFVGFVLSPEARRILQDTGQPPVVPALRIGAVPADLR
jgi:molybdate transport system substrate-binding protein